MALGVEGGRAEGKVMSWKSIIKLSQGKGQMTKTYSLCSFSSQTVRSKARPLCPVLAVSPALSTPSAQQPFAERLDERKRR